MSTIDLPEPYGTTNVSEAREAIVHFLHCLFVKKNERHLPYWRDISGKHIDVDGIGYPTELAVSAIQHHRTCGLVEIDKSLNDIKKTYTDDAKPLVGVVDLATLRMGVFIGLDGIAYRIDLVVDLIAEQDYVSQPLDDVFAEDVVDLSDVTGGGKYVVIDEKAYPTEWVVQLITANHLALDPQQTPDYSHEGIAMADSPTKVLDLHRALEEECVLSFDGSALDLQKVIDLIRGSQLVGTPTQNMTNLVVVDQNLWELDRGETVAFDTATGDGKYVVVGGYAYDAEVVALRVRAKLDDLHVYPDNESDVPASSTEPTPEEAPGYRRLLDEGIADTHRQFDRSRNQIFSPRQRIYMVLVTLVAWTLTNICLAGVVMKRFSDSTFGATLGAIVTALGSTLLTLGFGLVGAFVADHNAKPIEGVNNVRNQRVLWLAGATVGFAILALFDLLLH